MSISEADRRYFAGDAKLGDPVALLRGLEQAIRSICAIENAGSSNGTGVLIGPDLVLTNYHVVDQVLEKKASLDGAECRFDYVDEQSDAAAGFTVPIADVDIAHSPPSAGDEKQEREGFSADRLDYAIIRIAQPVGNMPDATGRRRGWIPLPKDPRSAEIGSKVIVLQHPWGVGRARDQQSLKLSIGEFEDLFGNGLRLQHNAATRAGSSGSPCFAPQSDFAFVALHNAGRYTDDKLWRQAVPLTKIVRHINDAFAFRAHALRIIGNIPPAAPPPDAARAAKELARSVERRRQAALCLMDRADEENRFTMAAAGLRRPAAPAGPKPLLHVIVCRERDAPDSFFDRLTYIPLGGANDARQKTRLEALKNGFSTQVWQLQKYKWPPPGPLDDRLYELEAWLFGLDDKGRQLLIVQRRIDIGWSEAAELELLTAWAAQLANRYPDGAERVQAVVAYILPDDAAADPLAARLAALWPRTAPPPHCGACVRFGQLTPDDLVQWQGFLDAAWGRDAAFGDAIAALFRQRSPLPFSDVAKGLTSSLDGYITTMLADASLRTDALEGGR